jgi:hypothetical protein
LTQLCNTQPLKQLYHTPAINTVLSTLALNTALSHPGPLNSFVISQP